MSYKYLGRYEICYEIVDGEEVTALVPEGEELLDTDTHYNWYDMGLFMRSEGSVFDGIYGECNTSAIGIKLDDSGDSGKLWRLT